MKISIDISEFYLDEEDNFEESFKNYIKNSAIQYINSSIKEKIEKQVFMEVKDIVEKNLYKEITSAIKKTVETCNMPSRKNRGESVTMEEYVKECFIDNSSYNSFDDVIKKIAANFSTEMKGRYDLFFASQLVAKMNDNGLLKDDIANLLLNPPSK